MVLLSLADQVCEFSKQIILQMFSHWKSHTCVLQNTQKIEADGKFQRVSSHIFCLEWQFWPFFKWCVSSVDLTPFNGLASLGGPHRATRPFEVAVVVVVVVVCVCVGRGGLQCAMMLFYFICIFYVSFDIWIINVGVQFSPPECLSVSLTS